MATPAMKERLITAKAYLQAKWVLHPHYNPNANPQHRVKGSGLLAPIMAQAKQAGRL